MFYIPWTYKALSDSETVVMPDGCRDILIVEDGPSDPNILLTDWDDRARTIRMVKGQQISGFRLCPGLSVDKSDLAGLETSETAISDFIEHSAATNRESIDLVNELTDQNVSFPSVAKRVGVSTRTLQRRLKKQGLPSADYWR